jgi:hypothetical protein
MDRERWQQIERLYHAAWAQPTDERARFLEGACPDALVRREVESLIAQATGGYLATGAGFAAESSSDEQSPGGECRRLGVNSAPPSLRIAGGGSSTAHLPSDIAAEQLDRLVVFSLVSGGLWAIGFVIDFFVVSQTSPRVVQIELFGVLVAVAISLYSRFAPLSAHTKADAGLWLMVLNSAAIASLERASLSAAGPASVSWIAIAILLTASILPNTPRKTLVAAMVSASMGPLGVWLA